SKGACPAPASLSNGRLVSSISYHLSLTMLGPWSNHRWPVDRDPVARVKGDPPRPHSRATALPVSRPVRSGSLIETPEYANARGNRSCERSCERACVLRG